MYHCFRGAHLYKPTRSITLWQAKGKKINLENQTLPPIKAGKQNQVNTTSTLKLTIYHNIGLICDIYCVSLYLYRAYLLKSWAGADSRWWCMKYGHIVSTSLRTWCRFLYLSVDRLHLPAPPRHLLGNVSIIRDNKLQSTNRFYILFLVVTWQLVLSSFFSNTVVWWYWL